MGRGIEGRRGDGGRYLTDNEGESRDAAADRGCHADRRDWRARAARQQFVDRR